MQLYFSFFIYLIYCAKQPKTTTKLQCKNVIMKKLQYFIVHSKSIISFKNLKLALFSCNIEENSNVFYNSAMYTISESVNVSISYPNPIYFIPLQNSLIDLSIYSNLLIKHDNKILKIKNPSLSYQATVLNHQNIILKNNIINNNAFEIVKRNKDFKLIIVCISSKSIDCYEENTNKDYIIESGTVFQCILSDSDLFWMHDLNNPYYQLKNFTEFQLNELHVVLEYQNDTLFFSGIYMTACFRNSIQIPRIEGNVYKIKTPLSNEIYLLWSKKAYSIKESQWRYSIKTLSSYQDSSTIPVYNIEEKINIYLTIIITAMQPLLKTQSPSLNQLKKYIKIIHHIIDSLMIEHITNEKINSWVILIQQIIDIIKTNKTTFESITSQIIIESILETLINQLQKITTKLIPIIYVTQTGVIYDKNLKNTEYINEVDYNYKDNDSDDIYDDSDKTLSSSTNYEDSNESNDIIMSDCDDIKDKEKLKEDSTYENIKHKSTSSQIQQKSETSMLNQQSKEKTTSTETIYLKNITKGKYSIIIMALFLMIIVIIVFVLRLRSKNHLYYI